ncbi:MAG TPA: biotin-dependent carboxyltransferase family protein [Longimicrobiales bacterium]|nr:biotin-dependent carboxyltransferase family protein [Longimicrobiales bacterium]
MSAEVRVLRSGLHTTVQDLGRAGHQHEGVPVCGAMDAAALRLANLLVGNPEGAASLEVTLIGPTLELAGDVLLSVTGADLSASLDERPLAPGRMVHACAGSQLTFGPRATGCRAYVAFAGGIAVPPVLGSRSTYLAARLGGMRGRALVSGDVLPIAEPGACSRALAAAVGRGRCAPWRPAAFAGDTAAVGNAEDAIEVRALRGRHFAALTSPARGVLLGGDAEWFTVSGASDRMGYRLEGPALALEEPLELISEGVAFGTVQLPPDGAPIVLMADRQTTGGYPRVLEVASVDRRLLAQARPGTRVRFREISLDEARRVYIAREHELARLADAIALRAR